jgi:hypothetical protein
MFSVPACGGAAGRGAGFGAAFSGIATRFSIT